MQVLTPTGYRDASAIVSGDEVCAFDAETGATTINHVEAVQPVDYAEWCRWWQVEETIPAFNWIRVNDTHLLFGEQSIWRNGTNVCHAKHLTVGDEIYDDADKPITITAIENVTDESLIWYRFSIDGDHSYIVDGSTVHNASRYWVGGAGTWDASDTTHWAASSGGAGGQSVPSSADDVWIDGSSGGGTVTPNFGGTITTHSLILWGSTFDNSVNNNNMTITGSTGLNSNTSSTRTVKLGAAVYTLSAGDANYDFSSTSGLTFDGSSATIAFTGATGTRVISSGGLSHGSFSFGASSGAGYILFTGSSSTYAALAFSGPNYVQFLNGNTITSALNWLGSSSGLIFISSGSPASVNTLNIASGSVAKWCAFRSITFSGATLTATSSFDLGNNTGITITPPSSGGGSFGVIGS